MTNEAKTILRTVITALAVGLVGFFALVIILQPFFRGVVVLPQHLNLGPLRLQFYGLIIAIAALVGYWLMLRRKETYEVESNDVDTLFFIVLVTGFIGARVYHVLSELGYYLANLDQLFAVWNGGLSIFGAALGGMLGLLVYNQVTKKYSLIQLLDWMVPGLAVGQLIGRFGNFVNYEIYGTPTEVPWKMYVPSEFRLPPFEPYLYFHPLFLYEAAGSAVILVLLLRLKLPKGYLFLLWLFLYNMMRFFLEFLRVGSITYGTVRVNAVVSLVLVVLAIFAWYYLRNNTDHAHTSSSSN